MQRVRAGLTGLAAIFLIVMIGAASLKPHRAVAPSGGQGETLAVLGVAAGVAGVVLPTPSMGWPTFGQASNVAAATIAPAHALSPTAPTAQQAATARRIYRHSVVPGGVADKVELAQILRSDRLVAAHYASFNVGNARFRENAISATILMQF